jgi:hypothetical protein
MHNLVKISGFENQTNSILEISAKNCVSSNNVQQKFFLMKNRPWGTTAFFHRKNVLRESTGEFFRKKIAESYWN